MVPFDKPFDEEVFAATQLAPYLARFYRCLRSCIFNPLPFQHSPERPRTAGSRSLLYAAALVQQTGAAQKHGKGYIRRTFRRRQADSSGHSPSFKDMKVRMHLHQTAFQTPARLFSRKGSTRWLLALSLALTPVTACCFAQDTPDALTIVRNASFNELKAGDGSHPFRYRLSSVDNGKATVKEIIETRDGDMFRLLEAERPAAVARGQCGRHRPPDKAARSSGGPGETPQKSAGRG